MEKIKLSQIREKFPMYGDLPDEKLLMGLRKTYYSDIPMQDFIKRIEFDNAPDATAGMSTGGKILAGIGQGMTDVAYGAGQMLGLVSRDDVADKRKTDKALLNTGAGKLGSVVGNVAATAPLMFAPGANTYAGAAGLGALTGLMQPSTSTGETVTNTVLGGAAAPAAMLAGRAVGSAYQGVKSLVEPLTKNGQQRLVADVIQRSATDARKATANLSRAKPVVPGSSPTAAQVADDAGLAQLERTMRNNPELAQGFQMRDAAQRAARFKTVNDIAGTDDYYRAIKDGVKVFAREEYDRAFSEGIDQGMAKALKPQISDLMSRPSIKMAQSKAKALAREMGDAVDDIGSVRGLHYLKMALDDQISAAKRTGSLGDTQLRALTQTKNDLLATIEQIAPAYKVANDNYAAMMRQVNSMDVARNLSDKFKPGLGQFGMTAKESGESYARELSKALDSIKSATGMDLPLNRVMPMRDVQALEGVAQDLARKSMAETLGRSVGSPTAQNIIGQNSIRRTLGPLGAPESWAESNVLQGLFSPVQGLGRVSGATQNINELLAQTLLDPQMTVRALAYTKPTNRAAQFLLPRVDRAVPYLTTGGLLATSE